MDHNRAERPTSELVVAPHEKDGCLKFWRRAHKSLSQSVRDRRQIQFPIAPGVFPASEYNAVDIASRILGNMSLIYARCGQDSAMGR